MKAAATAGANQWRCAVADPHATRRTLPPTGLHGPRVASGYRRRNTILNSHNTNTLPNTCILHTRATRTLTTLTIHSSKAHATTPDTPHHLATRQTRTANLTVALHTTSRTRKGGLAPSQRSPTSDTQGTRVPLNIATKQQKHPRVVGGARPKEQKQSAKTKDKKQGRRTTRTPTSESTAPPPGRDAVSRGGWRGEGLTVSPGDQAPGTPAAR